MKTQTREVLVHNMAPWSVSESRRAVFGLDTVEDSPFGSVEVSITPLKSIDAKTELSKYRVTVLVEKIAD